MTNREAIKFGKRVLFLTPFDEMREFCEIAIKALEQEPCEDCISRSDAINAMSNTIKRIFPEHRDIAEKTMNKLPPVTPQHTDVEIKKMQEIEQAEIQKAYELGKAEMQSSNDCVSRQAVIEALTKTSGIRGDALKALYDLPPVTLQPKIGHWIRVDKDKCKCDQCEVISFIAMYPNGDINYCPNCGAKMQEVEE